MRSTQKSIFRKILVPILVALVLQAVLLYGVIAYGGTLAQLRNNTYGIFGERVDSRADQLENEMVQRWSNLRESVERILDETDQILGENKMPVAELMQDDERIAEFLDRTVTDVLYLLRKNSVTGAYLILDSPDEAKKPALYVTDPDPDSNPSDYSDLQVECAPPSVTKQLGIALSSFWGPQMETEGHSFDFFERPLQAARAHPEIGYEDLGYWGRPMYRSGDGSRDETQVITYSVPLIYNGTPFGVLGVEITVDFLAKTLPEKSLGQVGSAFVLAVSADETRENYLPAVCSSGALRQTLMKSPGLLLSHYSANEDYRTVDGVATDRTLITHVAPLRLYNTHTPFESDQWAVLGVVYQQDLLWAVSRFQTTLMLACLLTFGVGILVILQVSRRIARPISLLSNRVKYADPTQPILLPKLRIGEIDELSDSIEHLSAEVVASAAKLSQILDMADISIGAFEYDKKSEGVVFLTERFFRILCGGRIEMDHGLMDSEHFAQITHDLIMQAEERVTEKEDSVFSFRYDCAGMPYWSRLKLISDRERMLGVVTDITQEVLEKRRLEYDRDYDILSNLYNRRAFQSGIRLLMDAPELLKTAALIMMDLDNLKFINDTYGHDLGDEYIRSAAMALKKASGVQALVARLSGDEFVVFLHGFDTREGVRKICKDIQLELQSTNIMLPDGAKVPIRASAGLAWYPDDAKTVDELVRYADFAMYMVKRVNKGQFTDFNLETYHKESYLLHGREELNLILEQGLIDYHFQPVFDAVTGEIYGYEALMRPHSETVRTPLELLSLARSQSRLQRVEELTLFRGLKSFLNLDIGGSGARVFLNSIPSQILSQEQIARFETQFKEHLSRIVIEITEEERSDPKITHDKQHLIEQWGASMALDDFGVGYNGETALLEFKPGFIKLDISIVKNVSTDPNRYQLLENLISYSRERGIKVIAEGVEYQEDMESLIRAGANYLQGYLLAKPSPAPQMSYPASTEQILKVNQRVKDETK